MPKIHLTSLLLVEERLLEAAHFARRLGRQRDPNRLGYELNAFLAAARSVTFLLQKEMAAVPGFAKWWDGQRKQLANDSAANFFLKLRNFSQKEGRGSVVGSAFSGRRRWSYRFAGNVEPVPTTLLHRDVADCCREHVAKLARIVLVCADVFPYHTCPRRALTPEGVAALQLSLQDVEESLGFPRGWTETADPASHDRRIDVLREQVDGVDFAAVRRLARWKPRNRAAAGSVSKSLSEQLLTSLVMQLERRRRVDLVDLSSSLLHGAKSQPTDG